MNNSNRNIFLGIFILLLQLLVLNNINVGGLINPYIYPLILLILPFDIAGWLLLIIAFFLGLTIDVFTGTLGLHLFASLLVAGTRPSLINVLNTGKIEPGTTINIQQHGAFWIVLFISFAFVPHHVVYFSIESFSFTGLGYTILRIILSSFISITISMLILFLFKNEKKK